MVNFFGIESKLKYIYENLLFKGKTYHLLNRFPLMMCCISVCTITQTRVDCNVVLYTTRILPLAATEGPGGRVTNGRTVLRRK